MTRKKNLIVDDDPQMETNDSLTVNNDAHQSRVGRSMTAWTNNLIATSVVVIMALVVGRHLVSSWVGEGTGLDLAGNEQPVKSGVTSVSPNLSNTSLQFGDGAYVLLRQQLPLTGKPAGEALLERCRQALIHAPTPAFEATSSEKALIEKARHWQPVEQQLGEWRLFNGLDSIDLVDDSDQSLDSLTGALPMIIGLRDNCPNQATRLVVFGLALPATDSTTTTLVFQANGVETNLRFPIPAGCRRTLVVGTDQQGQLAGFVGGTLQDAKAFYDQSSAVIDWKAIGQWKLHGVTWSRRFVVNEDSGTIQNSRQVCVQLSLDESQIVRGMLVIEPVRDGDVAETSHSRN